MKKGQRGAVSFNDVAKWDTAVFNDLGCKATHGDSGISPPSKIFKGVQHADGAISGAQRPRHRLAVDEHSIAVAACYDVLHYGERVGSMVRPF